MFPSSFRARSHIPPSLKGQKNHAVRNNSECCRNKPSDQEIERAYTHMHSHTTHILSCIADSLRQLFGTSASHTNIHQHYSTAYLNKKQAWGRPSGLVGREGWGSRQGDAYIQTLHLKEKQQHVLFSFVFVISSWDSFNVQV